MTSLSQGRTAAAQCGFFTHKSLPVIFEPPFTNTTNLTVFSQPEGAGLYYRVTRILKIRLYTYSHTMSKFLSAENRRNFKLIII